MRITAIILQGLHRQKARVRGEEADLFAPAQICGAACPSDGLQSALGQTAWRPGTFGGNDGRGDLKQPRQQNSGSTSARGQVGLPASRGAKT